MKLPVYSSWIHLNEPPLLHIALNDRGKYRLTFYPNRPLVLLVEGQYADGLGIL